jgi:signal peptidase I
VVLALFASMLVKMFLVQAYRIPSGSMEDTLRVGDRVLTNRVSYDLHDIHRGDIVVFSGAGTWNGPVAAPPSSILVRWWDSLAQRAGVEQTPGTTYVKRVIGLPGDTVACCNSAGQVTVNGVALDESSYVSNDSYWAGHCPKIPDGVSPRCFGPVRVKPGMLWVMGDNRAISDDSRRHEDAPGGGSIDSDRVLGKAILVIAPLRHFRTLGTPTTFAGVPSVAMVLPVVVQWRRRRRPPAQRGQRPQRASRVVP